MWEAEFNLSGSNSPQPAAGSFIELWHVTKEKDGKRK